MKGIIIKLIKAKWIAFSQMPKNSQEECLTAFASSRLNYPNYPNNINNLNNDIQIFFI